MTCKLLPTGYECNLLVNLKKKRNQMTSSFIISSFNRFLLFDFIEQLLKQMHLYAIRYTPEKFPFSLLMT